MTLRQKQNIAFLCDMAEQMAINVGDTIKTARDQPYENARRQALTDALNHRLGMLRTIRDLREALEAALR